MGAEIKSPFWISQKTLGSGDFSSPVFIRQKDVIHPIAGEMNIMVEEYRQTLKDIKAEVQGLE